jgi:putative tryptophan/tyrosine transport system substrate-binding protein
VEDGWRESSRTPGRAPAQRRTSTSYRRGPMRRIGLAVVLTLDLVLTTLNGQAQRTPAKVGFLCVGSREQFAYLLLAFEERMVELGHVRGKDLSIEPRFANGQADLPRLSDELVRLKIDLLLVHGNAVLAAAKQATTTIPIVTAGVVDPVGAGFIASVARPGGNITGVTSDVTTEIWGKRLELLKEAVPAASRIALLWNPTDQARLPYVNTAEEGARKLGVTFIREEFRSASDFTAAFASMAAKRVGAVLIAGHPATLAGRAEIVKLAAHHPPSSSAVSIPIRKIERSVLPGSRSCRREPEPLLHCGRCRSRPRCKPDSSRTTWKPSWPICGKGWRALALRRRYRRCPCRVCSMPGRRTADMPMPRTASRTYPTQPFSPCQV